VKQIPELLPSIVGFVVHTYCLFDRLLSGDKHLVLISQNGNSANVGLVGLSHFVADGGRWREAEPSPGTKCLKRSLDGAGAAHIHSTLIDILSWPRVIHTTWIQTSSTAAHSSEVLCGARLEERHGATTA